MMNPKLQEILENQRIHWNNVVLELLNGRKETHWCWYFLPNIPGLGTSEQSRKFAVTPDEFIEFMQNSEYAGNIHTVMHLIDRAHRTHPSLDILYVMGDNEIDVLKLKSFYSLYRGVFYHGVMGVDSPVIDFLDSSQYLYGQCEKTWALIEESFEPFNVKHW